MADPAAVVAGSARWSGAVPLSPLPPSCASAIERYTLTILLAPPRLSPRIQFRILRAACRLPARLQRVLFGAPPQIDGLELAPDIQALLRLAEISGDGSISGNGTFTPDQAREKTREGSTASSGAKLPLATVSDLEIPSEDEPISARFYDPGGLGLEQRPLIVYYHGGGWVIGDLDTHDGLCRFLAANAGVTVLSVDYRLAPEHPFPAALDDAIAAFEWAASAGNGRLGADPQRIVVAGDSAGANLAGAVSIAARDNGGPRPAMQALIYPVTDATGGQRSRELFAEGFFLTRADMDWFEGKYLPADHDAADPRISILLADDLAGLPPAYVMTAGFDPLRDEGEDYAKRMREAGVSVALRRQPGLIHGFANLTAVSRTSEAAMLELCGALRMGLS